MILVISRPNFCGNLVGNGASGGVDYTLFSQ